MHRADGLRHRSLKTFMSTKTKVSVAIILLLHAVCFVGFLLLQEKQKTVVTIELPPAEDFPLEISFDYDYVTNSYLVSSTSTGALLTAFSGEYLQHLIVTNMLQASNLLELYPPLSVVEFAFPINVTIVKDKQKGTTTRSPILMPDVLTPVEIKLAERKL